MSISIAYNTKSIVSGSSILGPNIVRDGLILHVDAANSKSYPGSGTTWYDLSRNGNNVSITNLIFNQNDNLGSITGQFSTDTLNGINNGDEHTITLIGKSLVFLDAGGNEILFYSNGYQYFSAYPFSSPSPFQFSYSQNDTIKITYTVSDTKTIFYVNGSKIGEVTHDNISGFEPQYITGQATTTLNVIKIYNRVLSEDEVQQNFNALKGRFGL